MLRISCFSTFQAFLDDQEITRFRSAKERALLIYLAVEQERAHQRASLAGLLWPDEPEAKARHNLSQTLVNLRKAIGDRAADPPYLLISPQTLAFNPESHHQVDVRTFAHHLADGIPAAQQKAIDLYTGPFLEEFVVAESDLLENWILTQRETLHQQSLDTFSILRTHYESAGELQQAQQVVRRLLALAPWQEEAHCQLMRLLALSGERTMALAQYDTLSDILMDELGVSPSDETNALYDEILAGELTSSSNQATPALSSVEGSQQPPATPALSSVEGSHQLPLAPFQVTAQLPHFVGREREIAQIRELLNQPGTPVVALGGMGGLGKTSLVTQIAHAVRGGFEDGVLWANPAISSIMDILDNWGKAYGYDFSGLSDTESRSAAVRGVLAEKSVLLVLDNVTNASQVKPFIAGGERSPILLTTRDLDVAHALNAEVVPLGELSAESGRDLLVNILGEERIVAEEADAAQICQLLHYLPLAVEIAAQRLKSRARMTLNQMAQRLGDTSQRLGLKISDQAVRTSFEVSWEALDEELQGFFPHLAVFEGRPFTAEALAYVAEMDSIDVEDLLYGLNALSLVKEDEVAYYRQHPLLADFAREKLDSSAYHQQHGLIAEVTGEKLLNADYAYGRLVDYYLAFVKENQQNYELLEPEWGNIGAAIEVGHRLEKWAQVLAFTYALSQTWLTRARYGEARQAYALAQEAVLKQEDEEARAKNLLRWGEVCIEQNDYDEAEQRLTDSLELYYQLEEGEGIANTQYHLATLAVERNNYDEATDIIATCLTIRQQLNDKPGIAAALLEKARIHYDLDDFEQARTLATQALTLQQEIDGKQHLVPTLRILAQIASMTQQHESALSFCQDARDLSEELHDQGELAATLFLLTGIYRFQQNYALAKFTASEAMNLIRRLGLRKYEGMLLYQLGHVYRATGKVYEACQCVIQSIEIFSVIKDDLDHAYSLLLLGDLHVSLGQTNDCQVAWQKAKSLGQACNHPWLIAQLEQRLGCSPSTD